MSESIYTLNDGTHISLTEMQDRELRNLKLYNGVDIQQSLHNLKKYGKFQPTKEDFAAYRERANSMHTTVTLGDAQTGFAGMETGDVFNMLRTVMAQHLPVNAAEQALKLMEELRRRLAAAPNQEMASLAKAQADLAGAIKLRDEAVKARDDAAALKADHEAKMLEAREVIFRLDSLKADREDQVRSLEHRITNLKEELPEEIKAGGRALSL